MAEEKVLEEAKSQIEVQRKKKIAVYERISTFDKGQTTESQDLALSEYIDRNKIVKEDTEIYLDYCSGMHSHRRGLDKLLQDVRKGLVSKIVIWRLDRLGRSLQHLLSLMGEFKDYGVEVVSLKESLDTSTAAGKLLFHMLASFSQFERDLISERTKAGLLNAVKKGKVLGRPRKKKR